MKRVSLLLVIGAMLSLSVPPSHAFAAASQAASAPTARKRSVPARPTKPAEKQPAEKQQEDCGCEASAPAGVLAFVNGVKVSLNEVYDPIKDQVQALQNQIINARQRELELQIAAKVFEAEAKRRGTTTQKLLERELAGKVKDPTDAEAQSFYRQNQGRIQGEFSEVKASIAIYIRDQRVSEETQKLAMRLGGARIRLLVEKVTPPETEADRARVLATVDGQRITSGDVEESLAPALFNLQEQIYELRKKQLDAKINDVLLEQEANKRGTTAPLLFDAEVTQKLHKVTDEEIQTFYQDNKERLGRPLYQVRSQVVEYLQGLAETEATAAYADQLRKAAKVQVFLKTPDPPLLKIAIDDQPWTGAANARVTIVEFTDYECPSCGRTAPVLEELIKEYGDRVKLVVRDFPLEMHAHAFKAALAAEAARAQGKYWEYAGLLFKNQKALEVDKLKEYATQVGLDRPTFDQALDSEKYKDNVQRDLHDGELVGVDSTPTVFINGRRVRDKTTEGLKAAIEAALKQAKPLDK
ncbi:MAG TPA: thioredoxin domain-containing protein [Blastocatellia bacterium]|nr:thioredoxin domain-containing protein [Blastocatellia bacterium]